MIIKFKTRTGKNSIYASKSLCAYVLENKHRDQFTYDDSVYFQNMDFIEPHTLHKSFLQNFSHIKKGFRKNGITLNHTIISIHPKDREYVTLDILHDLRDTFIQMAKIQDCVLLSKAHRSDKDQNIHIHLLYSHNKYRSKERVRLSKADMKKLLVRFESWHKSKYPQLQHSIVHTLDRTKDRSLTNIQKEEQNTRREKEYQTLRRYEQEGKGRKTKKQQVAELAQELLEKSQSVDQFIQALRSAPEVLIYTMRGQTRGILVDGIKYRFKTLGLEPEKIRSLDRYHSRLKELQLIREMAKSRQGRELGRGL